MLSSEYKDTATFFSAFWGDSALFAYLFLAGGTNFIGVLGSGMTSVGVREKKRRISRIEKRRREGKKEEKIEKLERDREIKSVLKEEKKSKICRYKFFSSFLTHRLSVAKED